jgi:DNA-binding CsgD family transcriptional regulator
MAEIISPSLSSFLGQAAWARLAEKLSLSGREVEVVKALLEDQRESEIARRLHVSPHTVHAHMDRLHGKLSVRSQPELILKILTMFLLMTAEPDSPLPPICGNRTSGRCPLNSLGRIADGSKAD